ncbi:MAG: tRNA glutamyl-Q(34) synthetase GluQRS [Burkholderiaceae bacterium]|jgi:glutamyl-Q tRNA(Asp) synthetase|nr:tRNA glutamyl-Q(34) synthetase GluQRS [Burkholderiaceae bacterium]
MGFARTGRFAPSPTGPLHAGSLVAALASWLDVRAHGPSARWLVRIEDADLARCRAEWGREILRQLAACGLEPDDAPVWQSQRGALYQRALDALGAAGWAYPCGCTRKDIDAALAARGIVHMRRGERVYPGTCRDGLHGQPARAWRFAADQCSAGHNVHWTDRRLGAQQQDVAHAVGDFILRRADGPWAYQLAVVVDDAEQGVTDIVRGADLADNTARQILLQRALGLPTPSYLHTPLVLARDGHKLSKQNGAAAIDTRTPALAHAALSAAAHTLGLLGDERTAWVAQWRDRFGAGSSPAAGHVPRESVPAPPRR